MTRRMKKKKKKKMKIKKKKMIKMKMKMMVKMEKSLRLDDRRVRKEVRSLTLAQHIIQLEAHVALPNVSEAICEQSPGPITCEHQTLGHFVVLVGRDVGPAAAAEKVGDLEQVEEALAEPVELLAGPGDLALLIDVEVPAERHVLGQGGQVRVGGRLELHRFVLLHHQQGLEGGLGARRRAGTGLGVDAAARVVSPLAEGTDP